jgi:hypothetical protein
VHFHTEFPHSRARSTGGPMLADMGARRTRRQLGPATWFLLLDLRRFVTAAFIRTI